MNKQEQVTIRLFARRSHREGNFMELEFEAFCFWVMVECVLLLYFPVVFFLLSVVLLILYVGGAIPFFPPQYPAGMLFSNLKSLSHTLTQVPPFPLQSTLLYILIPLLEACLLQVECCLILQVCPTLYLTFISI